MDLATVEKVARLARLKLTHEEKQEVSQDLGRILAWVETVEEVTTKEVAPMTSLHLDSMPQRKDEVAMDACVDDILANAPEKTAQMFVVPKVVTS